MAAVVTGAMATLLPKLADLLTEEYNLQRGVRGEIMFLEAEMESMQTALLKISEAPIDEPPDIQVKLWAKAVRDLSYDLEDSIEKFMVRLGTHGQDKSHSFKAFIDKSLSLLTKGKIRHKIGIDIKDIKSRIKEISERRDRYKVDNVTVAKPTRQTLDTLRLSALYKKATELVGTDKKRVEVVKMLMEKDKASNEQLKVVSIVGFGGLGKTTLANAVYSKLKVQLDDKSNKLHFDCTAFVYVSLDPNMNKLFKSLLHQLDKKKYCDINEGTWGEVQLIDEIRTYLADKRYLIVIDDIWDKGVWENIKYALIENEQGSRLITTTRILDVAQQAGGVYRLQPLSAVDSTKLFYQRIYGTEDKSPPNQLLPVSRNILKRCGGVPLAIVTIGSLLSSENGRAHTHEYWSKVYKSMGSGLDNSHDDVRNMRRILSVSYSDLPPHLKTCLLYLSLYTEDYEIETEQLIWKWVGEGFVNKEQGRSLYEIGEDYLDELINKSLVQPVNFDNADKVSSCCVHDMVHDLITSLSNEENFLTTVGSQQSVNLPTKIRRLSVQRLQTSIEEVANQLPPMSVSHVRSLTVQSVHLPTKIRRLSVQRLQTSIEEVANQLPPMSVSHVRSLTVPNSAFSLLPTLKCFPVLRVLDLTDCSQVDNNHWKDICSLFHLRYLSLNGTFITKIPREIENLKFLQVLDIRFTEIQEELPSTFIQLRQLLLLHMTNSIVGAVPRWICSMSTLFSLSITLQTLGEEDLQLLGSLPSLGELRIKVQKPTQGRDRRLVIGSGYPFLCLTRFTVESYTMQLRFARGAMENLQSLCLEFCDVDTFLQFGDFTLGLENLPSLRHIKAVLHDNLKNVSPVKNAIKEEIEFNPNKPKLTLKVTSEQAKWEELQAALLTRKAALQFIQDFKQQGR